MEGMIVTFDDLGRDKRAMPLMVDPGLYLTTKSNIFWVSPRRALPTAFKLFTGQYYLKKAVFVLYGC